MESWHVVGDEQVAGSHGGDGVWSQPRASLIQIGEVVLEVETKACIFRSCSELKMHTQSLRYCPWIKIIIKQVHTGKRSQDCTGNFTLS